MSIRNNAVKVPLGTRYSKAGHSVRKRSLIMRGHREPCLPLPLGTYRVIPGLSPHGSLVFSHPVERLYEMLAFFAYSPVPSYSMISLHLSKFPPFLSLFFRTAKLVL